MFSAHLHAQQDSAEVFNRESQFAEQFVRTHCITCHGTDSLEAGVNLVAIKRAKPQEEDIDQWQKVLSMLKSRAMPPESEDAPSADDYERAIQAVELISARFTCDPTSPNPGRVTIRRLNRAEYNNTVRDLTGLDLRLADRFPQDEVGSGFDNMADLLSLPPLLFEQYVDAAEEIVSAILKNEQAKHRIFQHRPSKQLDQKSALLANLRKFLRRAYRRLPTEQELSGLQRITMIAREKGFGFDQQLALAVQAALVSPHFLFLVEQDTANNSDKPFRLLNQFELASRLSYFLWSSTPDDTLLDLAEAGKLTDEELRKQILRMLSDPKSESLVKNFSGQWLNLRSLLDVQPDPKKFPTFDEQLKADAIRETELFFSSLLRDDGSVLDLLYSDYSFINQRLAKHYQIDGVTGEEFQRIKLPDQRGGILTQASILTLTSNPTRTSPVKRGKWILENILGSPPPPPPPGAGELEDDEEAELLGSLRERMEQHRADPICASCHNRMDPLGFGFENFDAVGVWRDKDGKVPVDASGILPDGQAFSEPRDLLAILRNDKKEEFCRCLSEKMLTYAIGRGLLPHDRCAVDDISTQLVKGDYRISQLVLAIVGSDPFRLRSVHGEQEQ